MVDIPMGCKAAGEHVGHARDLWLLQSSWIGNPASLALNASTFSTATSVCSNIPPAVCNVMACQVHVPKLLS